MFDLADSVVNSFHNRSYVADATSSQLTRPGSAARMRGMKLSNRYRNLAVRLLAVIICMPLGMAFVGDVIGGWEDQPYSRATGAVGLVFTAALLALIFCASRRPAS